MCSAIHRKDKDKLDRPRALWLAGFLESGDADVESGVEICGALGLIMFGLQGLAAKATLWPVPKHCAPARNSKRLKFES